ncbi:hypothetical protein ACJRO7_005175 [Eucalyptus globulus]|uniref:LOB domain-containing protein n=1 Tax=Eucalyptus globulus TaxID=34317 RepID=A0ABD3IZA4_EUCGL
MDGGGVRRRRACARCRVMKKKCWKDCRWAPYFPAGEHERFTILRRVFGGNMIMEILQQVPNDRRADANARENDPVNGRWGQLAQMIAEEERLQVPHQADG